MLGQAFALMLAAVLLVLALRRLLLRRIRHDEPGSVVDTVMEPLAGVYGLLLAFLVSGAADRTVRLRAALEAEASAYQRVLAIAARLPPPLGSDLDRALRDYAQAETAGRSRQAVVHRSDSTLNAIWLALASFEPARARDGVLQSEGLNELRVLYEQRSIATSAHRHAHGGLIWLVLTVGSLSVISVCAVASGGDPRAPFYLAALTSVIIVTLFVLYALSRPLPIKPFQLS